MTITTRLRSLSIRREFTNNSSGLRTITSNGSLRESSAGGALGFIKNLFGKVIDFVGFGLKALWQGVKWVFSKINFEAIVSACFTGINALLQFDFNATDEELKKAIEDRNTDLWSIWGDFFGQGFGWAASIATGTGLSYLVPVIGSATLARAVLAGTTKEAIEEISGVLTGAVSQTLSIAATNSAVKVYMAYRRFIKRLPTKALKALYGDEVTNFIKKQWGRDSSPELRIGSSVREWIINNMPSANWKLFADSAIDGFVDSFQEGMFVVAQQWDEAWLNHFAADITSDTHYVSVLPDRENPYEGYACVGDTESVKNQVMTVLNVHKMLNGRDVGYIGAVDNESLWLPEYQRQSIVLTWCEVPNPPWVAVDSEGQKHRPKRMQCRIPYPKVGLTWEEIKLAMGGKNGVIRGEWFCNMRIARRKLLVFGQTEESVIELAQNLASLSSEPIQSINTGRNQFRKGRHLVEKATRMYPQSIICSKKNFNSEDEKLLILEGSSYAETRKKFPMWTEKEPKDFSVYWLGNSIVTK